LLLQGKKDFERTFPPDSFEKEIPVVVFFALINLCLLCDTPDPGIIPLLAAGCVSGSDWLAAVPLKFGEGSSKGGRGEMV